VVVVLITSIDDSHELPALIRSSSRSQTKI